MRSEDFQMLSRLLHARSGLMLTEDKTYLIESRLLPIARNRGFPDIESLCRVVEKNPPEELLVEITEAMTTNESSFFRDNKPYEHLKNIALPRVMAANATQKIRIWSAACSTGQEPYSIAITLKEQAAKLEGWSFDLLGTDLANKVVARAKDGSYSQFEAQRGLPIQILIKYFTQKPDTSWQVKDEIRQMVQYKTHNLLESYVSLGRFDIIFCRNVLIYFDEKTKAGVTQRMSEVLTSQGVLVLGSTETLIDPQGLFKPLEGFHGAYIRRT